MQRSLFVFFDSVFSYGNKVYERKECGILLKSKCVGGKQDGFEADADKRDRG